MQPKKSLGQNFLRDKNILDKIIRAADLKADDFVIEIGPGEGVLTLKLIKHTSKVIAIEKDENLAEKLAKNFQFSIFSFQSISNDPILNFKNKAAVIVGDMLKANLPLLIENNFVNSDLFVDSNRFNYKVIANIPYYITSPIIKLFLETKYPPKEMILMVQKEVAERICASPGQMSILAVSVRYYAKAELLFHVDRKSFWPAPEVDSAVIRIHETRNMKHETKEDTKNFFRIVKAGFSAKRKMLLNNLSSSLHLEKKIVEEKLKKVGIDPSRRAQELSVEEWKKLAKIM
ncbi:MAG: Ribosomal small subunit methyltransferase [Patescibacteria group bacterium]|nr:Ribosomal small subunit methyltransferase [Patescibacteria group bacterium]